MAVVGIVGAGKLGTAVQRGLRSAHEAPVIADSTGLFHRDALDAVVDASGPAAASETIRVCDEHRAGLVYCVSEVPPATMDALGELAERVPVVLAPNLSRMHWLQLRAITYLGELVGRYTSEVTDRHPRTKQPPASRTAELLAAAVGSSTNIGVLRAGRPVSDHTVEIRSEHESLVVAHSVRSLEAVQDGIRIAVAHVLTAHPGMTTISELFELATEENHGK
jgi:4-hydroxy-tetrahydrodipicolinate reductase